MKVFVVLYEDIRGNHISTLLVMRKVYGQPKIAARRWSDSKGLYEIRVFTTENYSRAAELYLSLQEDDYCKLLSVGEVDLQ